MNKKGFENNVKYDDKEDLEIRKVAYFKSNSSKILLIFLICLFIVMLMASFTFINSYYTKEENNNVEGEVIEINNSKNKVLIINNGIIKENINYEYFSNKNQVIIEKINKIEFNTNEGVSDNGIFSFDIRYDILENDFKRSDYSNNDSPLLVRFAYSYDSEEWTYLNNAISIDNSNITPLMGSVYDIAGIKSNLKVITNYEISLEPGESKIMYWKCETIFNNARNEKTNNNLEAEFKIQYQDNN